MNIPFNFIIWLLTARVGGNTEDAFWRSPPWSLPPHRTATPAPRRGRLWEDPTLTGLQAAPTLRPTPSHYPPFYTIPSGGSAAIEVSTRRLCRPSTGKYVLRRKNPFWQLRRWSVPDNSIWDRPGQGNFRRVKTPSPATNHQDPTAIGTFCPFTLLWAGINVFLLWISQRFICIQRALSCLKENKWISRRQGPCDWSQHGF